MHCRPILLPVFAAAGLALAAPAGAQYGLPLYPAPSGRVTFDAFLTSHFIEPADGGGRATLGGAGGRLLYWLDSAPATPGPRLGVGAFLTATDRSAGEADGSRAIRSEHIGAELDLRLAPLSAARAVEPVFSLGVGAFRTRERAHEGGQGRVQARLQALTGADVSDEELSWSGLAVSPGVGARVRLSTRLSLRADLRDAIVLRDRARHFVEAIGGISIAR